MPEAVPPALKPPSDDFADQADCETVHGQPGTVLGFDYGEKRIGVAVGQAVTCSATPLDVLRNPGARGDWAPITKLLQTWRPDVLVVGLPLALDGGEQPLSTAARRFARRLRGRYGLRVCLVDERLSSREADSLLRASGTHARARRVAQLDGVAAKLIAETWLGDQGASAHEIR